MFSKFINVVPIVLKIGTFSVTHGCTDIPGEKLICVTFMFQAYVIFVFQIYPKLYIY